MNTNNETKLVKILICAMGGEGGGVLMNWIVKAAWAKGYPIQATSVPGVAQRTGATTYYIEMLPQVLTSASPRPVFALIPTAGEVDLLIATEAAEATRAAGNGMITPDRTHLIASTSRVFLMPEKMAMTDGRVDNERLRTILDKSAHTLVLFDANRAAKEAGAIVNAVMLGAVAATDVINIALGDFISAIQEEGKAVGSNIAGLKMGYGIASGDHKLQDNGFSNNLLKEGLSKGNFPKSIQPILEHATNRLTDYQNANYVNAYMSRLQEFKDSDEKLLNIIAKQLALRMSYEDIIRVAQAKIRFERFERIKSEAGTSSDDILMVTDFFKPGIAEISDMLPTGIGKRLRAWGEKTGKIENFGFGMTVQTTSVTGFLKLWVLAKIKWWRPKSYRWKVEQASIDEWLNLVTAASRLDMEFACEVAELARLIKGYGSTHRRGMTNFLNIVNNIVKPIINSDKLPNDATKNLRLARNAATGDPDGSDLNKVLKSSFVRDIAITQ
jgi:indolepyruvate ferredoxin oxidoreductase beta subunit